VETATRGDTRAETCGSKNGKRNKAVMRRGEKETGRLSARRDLVAL